MGDPRSLPVVVSVVALTVLLVVTTLAVWSRVRGGPVLRTAQRVGLIVACQVGALAVAGALVNRADGFYTSWSDLLGAGSDTPVLSAGPPANAPADPVGPAGPAQADPTALLPAHGTSAPVPATPFVPGPHGTLTLHTVGATSKIEGDVYVWTPPGYDAAHPGGYPVLLALGGSPGVPLDAIVGLDLESALTTAFSDGTLPPTIVVAATTNVANRDRGCADIPGGDQVATWLTRDVPTLVRAHFDVAPDTRWSAIGLSSGGYCAARLALTHPDLLGAGISLAGNNLPDATDLRDTAALRTENDLRTMAARGANPQVSVLAAASAQDGTTLADARELQSAAGPGVVVDLETVRRGGHNFAVWASMVPPALTWLGAHRKG